MSRNKKHSVNSGVLKIILSIRTCPGLIVFLCNFHSSSLEDAGITTQPFLSAPYAEGGNTRLFEIWAFASALTTARFSLSATLLNSFLLEMLRALIVQRCGEASSSLRFCPKNNGVAPFSILVGKVFNKLAFMYLLVLSLI